MTKINVNDLNLEKGAFIDFELPGMNVLGKTVFCHVQYISQGSDQYSIQVWCNFSHEGWRARVHETTCEIPVEQMKEGETLVIESFIHDPAFHSNLENYLSLFKNL